jgi:tetratricopeptide (TPR) repeat protein
MVMRVAATCLVLALAGCVATADGAGLVAAGPVADARACYSAASQRQAGNTAVRRCDAAIANPALPDSLRVVTLVNRGIIHMDAGRIDTAIADHDAAIGLAPDNPDAYINKAAALLRVDGREREAIELLGIALELNPRNPEIAYFHRAVANEALGRLRAAYDDYAEAARLAPGWSEPANQLQRFKFVRRKTLAG